MGPTGRVAPPLVVEISSGVTSAPMWRRPVERLRTERFVLEPLGPQHNDADHAAWTASIDHIRATPGFRPELWGGDDWPTPMSADENRADLVQHAHEFTAGEAFAFTVLDPVDGDVIGCVYVDPDDLAEARCRCWVRADRAGLDAELAETVRAWLTGPEWGLRSVRFPGRD
jgi:RimJ/RimL family protein N-acetyltransferase